MQLVSVKKYPLKKSNRFWHIATAVMNNREFQAFYDIQDDVVEAREVYGNELISMDNSTRACLDVLLMLNGVTVKPMELPC